MRAPFSVRCAGGRSSARQTTPATPGADRHRASARTVPPRRASEQQRVAMARIPSRGQSARALRRASRQPHAQVAHRSGSRVDRAQRERAVVLACKAKQCGLGTPDRAEGVDRGPQTPRLSVSSPEASRLAMNSPDGGAEGRSAPKMPKMPTAAAARRAAGAGPTNTRRSGALVPWPGGQATGAAAGSRRGRAQVRDVAEDAASLQLEDAQVEQVVAAGRHRGMGDQRQPAPARIGHRRVRAAPRPASSTSCTRRLTTAVSPAAETFSRKMRRADWRAGLARDRHQPRPVRRPHQVDDVLGSTSRCRGCAGGGQLEDAPRRLAAIQRRQPTPTPAELLAWRGGRAGDRGPPRGRDAGSRARRDIGDLVARLVQAPGPTLTGPVPERPPELAGPSPGPDATTRDWRSALPLVTEARPAARPGHHPESARRAARRPDTPVGAAAHPAGAATSRRRRLPRCPRPGVSVRRRGRQDAAGSARAGQAIAAHPAASARSWLRRCGPAHPPASCRCARERRWRVSATPAPVGRTASRRRVDFRRPLSSPRVAAMPMPHSRRQPEARALEASGP